MRGAREERHGRNVRVKIMNARNSAERMRAISCFQKRNRNASIQHGGNLIRVRALAIAGQLTLTSLRKSINDILLTTKRGSL
jgi:hypothetical protein